MRTPHEDTFFQLVHYLSWAIFNWYAFAFFTPLSTGSDCVTHYWAELGDTCHLPHALCCIGRMLAQAVFRGTAGSIYTVNHEMPRYP